MRSFPRRRRQGAVLETLENRWLLSAYFFATEGNDTSGLGTQASPWATLAKANTLDLNAGDSINLKGGQSFSGGLTLDATDAGTASTPVTITSYGTGRATINTTTTTDDGLYVYNAAGIDVVNLNFTGPGIGATGKSGIEFYLDLSGGVKLDRIRIDQVNVSGFDSGINIGAWNASYSGFRDVRITNVNAFNNFRDGISTYGYLEANNQGTSFSHENFYVGYTKAYGNTGNSAHDWHTGSGIVLSGIQGAVIEYCEAYNNGANDGSDEGGPVGIWFWEVKNGTIQYSISHDNKRGPAGKDGGGFDIDGGSQNCVIQYCYSYNNAGPGYLLAQYPAAGKFNNNTVRYNISQNDSRNTNGNQGAIDLWSSGSTGGITNTHIYGNTVYLTSPATGDPAAIRFETGGSTITNVSVFNNIFVTTGTKRLVLTNGAPPNGTSFLNNAYYSSGSTFRITWNGVTYNSLAAWRTATGQENSGGPVGYEGDPHLTSAGNAPLLTDPTQLASLTAYKLLPDSPLINAGKDLAGSPNIGTSDFYGAALPQDGAFDIGAHEALPVPWQNADIGTVAKTGLASVSPTNVWTLKGAGTDIWGNADEFQFSYQTLTGNGEIVARVDSLQNTNAWAKAGLMIRADLTAGSANALVALAGASSNGVTFQSRGTANGTSTYTNTPNLAGPRWLKLVRQGSNFTAFHSTDGANWIQVGSVRTVTTGNTVYIGLAVTSHNASAVTTAGFSEVSVTPAPTTAPTVTVTAADAIEPGGPVAAGVFTLTRSSTAGSLTVNYTLSGTAWANDYTVSPTVGSVTFAAGSATATVTITPADDAVKEVTETVVMTLTSSGNYVIGGGPTTMNLVDSDVNPLPAIIINEVVNGFATVAGDFDGGEAIELLLTQDLTSQQLETYYFGDSTAATSGKNFSARLQNMASIASTFKAGTIIVVGSSLIPHDTSYNPLTGDWSLFLRTTPPTGTDYVLQSANDFAVASTGDVLWVGTSNSGTSSIHSIAFETDTPGAFYNAATVKLGTAYNLPIGSLSFLGGSADLLDTTKYDNANDGVLATLGQANGGNNSVLINMLRA